MRTWTGVALAAVLAAGGCGGERPARLGELTEMPAPVGRGSAEPHLAAGPDGRVYLSWLEPGRDSTYALRFAALDSAGTGWSEPVTIAQDSALFVNWADFPSIIAFSGNRLAAHWLQRTSGGKYAYHVKVAQSHNGGRSWQPGATPHRDTTATEHGFVSMWLNGDSVGTVWLDGRRYAADWDTAGSVATEEMMLVSGSLSPEGAPGPEKWLDQRVCDCCQTGVAVTSQGPVIAYRDRSADEIRDIWVVRLVNGGWTEPKPLHDDGWKIAACPVNGPQVAAEGRRVAIAWFTAARDTARVNVAFSDDAGETFGAPVRLDGGNPLGRVDVEMVDGGALVSWLENTGTAAEVRVRRVGADGAMGEPRVVATSTAERASGYPRMTRAGSTVYFAWTQPGERPVVRVARAVLEK